MHQNFRNTHFLVIGRAGMDLYADPPGTEIERASNFTAALGGSAANIAVAISRQGGHCALCTAVSDDAVGRFTLRALADYGVDTKYISTIGGEARNSLAVVETRAVNCQSVIYRNNAADFAVTLSDIAQIQFSNYAALIVTGTALALEPSRSATLSAMTMAKAQGLIIIIDLDYRPYSWISQNEAQSVCSAAAELCDIIVGNDDEFAVLAQGPQGLQLAEQLSQSANRTVIYKMGSNGCIVFDRQQRFDVPIFKVDALKPTGAGDAFMGGLIAARMRKATWEVAARQGAATAAIVVSKVGCAPAMPNSKEVEDFILTHSLQGK